MPGKAMRAATLATAALCAASDARTQDIAPQPLVDARLRWEAVDQDGLPKTADAVTLRVRSGVEASALPWSALVESEATIAIVLRYNDGLNARAGYPTVADPRNIALNRAQLRYVVPTATITVGRQVLEFGDQRFVGSSSFRQNQQTFDVARQSRYHRNPSSYSAGYYPGEASLARRLLSATVGY